ncbi:MAG: GNAT family N-acetyltransferase [Bacilli bacterium]|nr:GNAT family N-acetyltransferase [Bacilli bacterium]
MLVIKKVINEEMAKECDVLLTKLIQSERRFDDNVKETFVIKDNYKNKMDKEYTGLFLAYSNDKPVGYIFGYMKFEAGDFVYHSTAHIDALYVTENYRKQGIAKALMQEFYTWCMQKDIKSVEIGVFAKNKQAFELYKNEDFEVTTYYLKKNL